MPRTFFSIIYIDLLSLASGYATHNIWEAFRNGNYDRVQNLVQDNPQLIDIKQEGGERNKWPPLHAARAEGRLKIERILIKAGKELPSPPGIFP
ncbi:hypothetical protein JYU15_00145 [bacterium AH-315-I18]|nr:hypothetical protein [Phycisphaeraceae bacterium]MBN4060825.1 hypothetical protein [bacterium AH-315-I18]